MLACSLLLRWPDETNAIRFITGFQVVGDIEHTGLFRPLDPSLDRLCGKEALLGESALGNFQDMHRHVRPGSYDADLAAMTCYDPPRSG